MYTYQGMLNSPGQLGGRGQVGTKGKGKGIGLLEEFKFDKANAYCIIIINPTMKAIVTNDLIFFLYVEQYTIATKYTRLNILSLYTLLTSSINYIKSSMSILTPLSTFILNFFLINLINSSLISYTDQSLYAISSSISSNSNPPSLSLLRLILLTDFYSSIKLFLYCLRDSLFLIYLFNGLPLLLISSDSFTSYIIFNVFNLLITGL